MCLKSIFSDIALWSLLKVTRCFWRKRLHHMRCLRTNKVSKTLQRMWQVESTSNMFIPCRVPWRHDNMYKTPSHYRITHALAFISRRAELKENWHITSVRRFLGRLTLFLVHRFLSPWWWKYKFPQKRRFLQEPRGVTSQTTAFFWYLSCCLDMD
jgi:hypothetical protein